MERRIGSLSPRCSIVWQVKLECFVPCNFKSLWFARGLASQGRQEGLMASLLGNLFWACIFACMISLRSGPVGSKKWATQRLFAGSSSHPHTVILYSSRGVWSAPSPLPGSLPSPFLLRSISHCFSLNPWRVVLTSVWLLLLTYSSSGPRGIAASCSELT